MYRNKKTGIIGIIITTIILILVVILSNIDIQKMSYVENALNAFVMPIQNGLTYLKNKMSGNDSFFSDIEIIKSENETLKEYVNLKEKYQNYQTIPAYIINKDITNYNETIVINVGEKDGIKANMTVIADQGLVGHVISTTQTTAKVQTIIDPASSVSSNISTSREAIIVTGTLEKPSTLKASYIPTDASLLENDKIETSGLGGIYPKGIPIGTIKQIVNTKNVTDRYAYVETVVDFKKLETVLVITN